MIVRRIFLAAVTCRFVTIELRSNDQLAFLFLNKKKMGEMLEQPVNRFM
jgi:hypothetical protein